MKLLSMSTYVIFIGLFFIMGTVYCESAGKLSCSDAIEDVRYLLNAIEETHPDPYSAFGGKLQFKKTAMDLISSIPAEGLTTDELFHLLRPFTASMSDLHTRIESPKTETESKELYLPIKFKVASDGLFISSTSKEYQKLLGAKVVSVNNVSYQLLLERLKKVVGVENEYGLINQLRVYLRYFSVLNDLFDDVNITQNYKLLDTKSDTLLADFDMLNRESYEGLEWITSDTNSKIISRGLLSSQFLDDQGKVAYLRLSALSTREAFQIARANKSSILESSIKRVYERTLNKEIPDNMDEAIAGVPSLTEAVKMLLYEMKEKGSTHLIVDLRSNTGGWTESIHPMMYLLYGDRYFQTEFPVYWSINVSQYYLDKFNMTIDEFNKQENTNLKVGDVYFRMPQPKENGRIEREKYLLELKNKGLAFAEDIVDLNGNAIYTPEVIVLVSPRTSSAGFHLLSYLWHMGAKVIGVPPAQSGNAFMDLTPIELPHSKLKAYIAHSAVVMFPNDLKRGHLFRPDYEMNWDDFGRYKFTPDAEIEYALDLIKQGKI